MDDDRSSPSLPVGAPPDAATAPSPAGQDLLIPSAIVAAACAAGGLQITIRLGAPAEEVPDDDLPDDHLPLDQLQANVGSVSRDLDELTGLVANLAERSTRQADGVASLAADLEQLQDDLSPCGHALAFGTRCLVDRRTARDPSYSCGFDNCPHASPDPSEEVPAPE